MADHTVFTSGLFADDGFDFETRVVLGHIPYGGADAGEVLATIALIDDGDRASWVAAWSALGDRLMAAADASAAASHAVSAAGAYLRAATAYGSTINALAEEPTIDALLAMFHKHRAAWERFCAMRGFEPVQIPYEGRTLPGWLATPADGSSGPRPTLIANNGSDGAISTMLPFGGGGALARGYNVLFFDGPGQQSQLFDEGTTFRPDWEAVITPIVDFLLTRPEVDPDRICLYGVSQGGYWVPRAISREHRLAAAVADTGVVDVSQSWLRHIPAEVTDLVTTGQKDAFNKVMHEAFFSDPAGTAQWNFRARPYGSTDPYEAFSAMLQYRLTPEDAAMIQTPLLVTDPEDEQFWPGQAEQLAAMVSGSTLVRFTAAEGANFHCEPMARQLVDQRMYDWLDGILGR